MKKKEKGFLSGIKQKFKTLSIISTLAIHLSYISYLSYALSKDIGVRSVNIALIIGTSVFLIAFLILTLLGNGKNVKTTRFFYKRFKMITKLFTSGTAVYSLITASSAVSPLAMILPTVGAFLLAIRIVIDLLVFLLTRKAKRVINGFKNRNRSADNHYDTDYIELTPDADTVLDDN